MRYYPMLFRLRRYYRVGRRPTWRSVAVFAVLLVMLAWWLGRV